MNFTLKISFCVQSNCTSLKITLIVTLNYKNYSIELFNNTQDYWENILSRLFTPRFINKNNKETEMLYLTD